MIDSKKLALSLFFYGTCALGLSLTIKAAVGVSAFNSLNLALSQMSNIQVGTITIVVNMLFLLGYMLLTRFKYKIKYVMQIVFVVMFGALVNLYVYGLLSELEPDNYFVRLLLLAAGTSIGGLSVGVIIHLNVITFPIESFCVALEEKTSKSFAFYRYGVDMFSASGSLLLSLTLGLPLYIREGTIISMLLLTTSMNLSKNFLGKKRKDMLEYR